MCVKCFLLFTTVQKLYKSIKIFQSYDHKCMPPFYGSQCTTSTITTTTTAAAAAAAAQIKMSE